MEAAVEVGRYFGATALIGRRAGSPWSFAWILSWPDLSGVGGTA